MKVRSKGVRHPRASETVYHQLVAENGTTAGILTTMWEVQGPQYSELQILLEVALRFFYALFCTVHLKLFIR